MSWNETPVTIATAVKAGRVTFSANKTRAGGGVLGLPGAIVGQLGWKEGQTFKLLVGSADHDGWIRIVPNPQGEIVFHTFGRGPAAKGAPRGGRLRIGTFLRLTLDTIEKSDCEHRIIDKSLDVQLPAGALSKARAVKAA